VSVVPEAVVVPEDHFDTVDSRRARVERMRTIKRLKERGHIVIHRQEFLGLSARCAAGILAFIPSNQEGLTSVRSLLTEVILYIYLYHPQGNEMELLYEQLLREAFEKYEWKMDNIIETRRRLRQFKRTMPPRGQPMKMSTPDEFVTVDEFITEVLDAVLLD